MNPHIDGLLAHWESQDIELPSGVPEDRMREFESRSGVTLPPDLRGYFLRVDGMGSRGESDHEWFCFWPFADLVRASDDYQDPFIEDQSSYFGFADHSICLPAYAIRLNPSGTGPHPVIAIYSDNRAYETRLMALSFTGFVERYLAGKDTRLELGSGFPIIG